MPKCKQTVNLDGWKTHARGSEDSDYSTEAKQRRKQ